MKQDASTPEAHELRDPLFRSLVSLAIVLHLLCVGFVYSANVNASRLQQRLAGIFAPYTQLLHLDPGGARLQFTDGSPADDDHELIITPKLSDGTIGQADAVRIPDDESRLGLQRRRLLTLSSDLASFAQNPNPNYEELAALLAQSIGDSVMRHKQFDHVVVQVIHHGSESLYDDTPEDERSTDYTVYDAEVWRDEDGVIHTQKRTTGLGAAPTSEGAGS